MQEKNSSNVFSIVLCSFLIRLFVLSAKKETVVGEECNFVLRHSSLVSFLCADLGILIFRFYMKCPRCSSQFTIKTGTRTLTTFICALIVSADPKNSDYKSEWGCTRNFEKWKDASTLIEEAKEKQEKEVMFLPTMCLLTRNRACRKKEMQ